MNGQPEKGRIATVIGLSLGLCGIGILVYQAFEFIRLGYAPDLSLLTTLKMVAASPWLEQPSSWPLLHSMLDNLPFSLSLAGLGFLILLATDT